MTTEDHPVGQLQVCRLCREVRKLVRPVPTSAGLVRVGRCTVCDGRKCPRCEGYTADPGKHECRHCGRPWGD